MGLWYTRRDESHAPNIWSIRSSSGLAQEEALRSGAIDDSVGKWQNFVGAVPLRHSIQLRLGVFDGKGDIFYMTSKKKNTTPATPPPNPPTSPKTTTHVPPVALLIDGENAAAPDLIAYVLVEAGKMGGVISRQVYGNWAAPSMQSWRKYLTHYDLEQKGSSNGHNATDIALVIGAMDLLYRGIKHFCLVTGDSDYVPLVFRLRQEGCTVLVIGSPSASKALQEASSRFLATCQLTPQPQTPPRSPSPSTTTSPQAPNLDVLLTKAYHAAAQKSESEWVLLAQLGTALRELDATFKTTYGKKSLSTLIEQCQNHFESRKRTLGNGQVEEVRLVQNSSQKKKAKAANL